MPRKTLVAAHGLAGAADGFNEAAARCRGKPTTMGLQAGARFRVLQ